jgi:hypothetical protein
VVGELWAGKTDVVGQRGTPGVGLRQFSVVLSILRLRGFALYLARA